jgi:hypothetical protein
MSSMNRKELLCQFFRNELTDKEIKQVQVQLPQHYHLVYMLFNTLRDSGARSEDILKAKINEDGDVVLNLSNKSLARKISDSADDYTFNNRLYKLKINRSSNIIVASSKCVDE